MSLKDLEIHDQYRSDEYNDLGVYFLSPVLAEGISYKRAVGFFSSSALIKISHGISSLVNKEGGRVCLVVSPHLSKEDVEAIKQGYQSRQLIVENALLRDFVDTEDKYESERLNYLAHLIEQGVLDIKVADKLSITGEEDSIGIFHEKFGIIEDELGNKIAFTGSLNESDNAYSNNFESVMVFKNWEESRRVHTLEENFNKLWDDTTNALNVYSFPEAVKKKIFKYRKPIYHANIDEFEQDEKTREENNDLRPCYNYPHPLYDYQKQAINKWAKQGFKAIFDMGTGTGKTVTAYTASVKLLERVLDAGRKLAVIVVCPYTHLVEQWVADQKYFNINFIVGYSAPKYKDYLTKLKFAVQNFNNGVINHFHFITTNASFKSKKVQDLINCIKGEVLFIGDEVHNFGAEGLREVLNPNFQYRIGLSATVDRHRDEEGTEAIYDYFGKPCIHYGLKEAIENDVLTKYYYYPVISYLNEHEQELYLEYTEKIIKNSHFNSNGENVMSDTAELYALKRARIIATAQDKLGTLREVIKKYKDDKNLLIYCGTGKVSNTIGEEIKQIDEVCKILGNEFGMNIARYTSQESTQYRTEIAERFKDENDDLQALVAIKCLDEGVNIPSIKTAFILASSTNPREYVQRRGRVLRKFKGKDFSYIFDFVTLPFAISTIDNYTYEYVKSFKSLAKNEIDRISEFASLAENPSESDALINDITKAFKLDIEDIINEYEQIKWREDND